MTLQARTFLSLIAGAVAGLLAWALTDGTGWFSRLFGAHALVRANDLLLLLYGGVIGLFLGLLLALAEGVGLEAAAQRTGLLLWGAGAGALGGAVGIGLGQTVFGAIVGTGGTDALQSPGRFLLVLVARALGWGLLGAAAGAAQGLARRSPGLTRQAGFGGLVGGLLGGTVFEVTAVLLGSGALGRLTATVSLGALVGFFAGLVPNLFKQAWVRVVVGRNEGREYLLSNPVTSIGRSETGDIALYGDPSIAPLHAVIEALPQMGRYRLRHVAGGRDAHAYPLTVVNGRPVAAEQWLADGDVIEIASRTLLFRERAGAAKPVAAVSPPEIANRPRSAPNFVMPPDEEDRMPPAPLRELSETTVALPMGAWGASPSPAQMGTRLLCLGGPYSGQSFSLSHAPVTIGRAPDRSISLAADTTVSRRHARIAYENGRHVLADDGSANGTLLNGGRLLSPRPLSAGDLIQLGATALRYE